MPLNELKALVQWLWVVLNIFRPKKYSMDIPYSDDLNSLCAQVEPFSR